MKKKEQTDSMVSHFCTLLHKEVQPMAQKERATVNRNYKDTVFRMLFSDRRNLLSLYNAISGAHYDDPEKLEIVTLENAIYMGMKNDLAFILDMNLYLYEHQSTVNPNIPLRDLFYIAAEYQKLIDRKSLYSSAIQKIPTPGFFVFYNGIEPLEDCCISRLSDAFLHTGAEPALELIVTTLNINEGHNCELMQHCRKLKEYAQYVAKVRKYAEQLPLEDAVERAVTECIRENILADFLKKNRAEVVAMSIFEYDKVEEEKKLRKAEFEAGVEQGIEKGLAQGIERGEKQASVKAATRMLRMGSFSLEQIAEISGLSVDEIKGLTE